MNVSLTPELELFIDEKVDAGSRPRPRTSIATVWPGFHTASGPILNGAPSLAFRSLCDLHAGQQHWHCEKQNSIFRHSYCVALGN